MAGFPAYPLDAGRAVTARDQAPFRPGRPGGPHDPRPWTEAPGTTAACQGHWAHTGYMGRIIGTIFGAILAIWLVVTAAGGIVATIKAFLIIGLIAMAVFIVVWLVGRRPRRG